MPTASRVCLKLANIVVLDYVIITHYHGDHAGNAAELATRIPIRHFIDHGPYTVELQPNWVGAFASYQAVALIAHTKRCDAVQLVINQRR